MLSAVRDDRGRQLAAMRSIYAQLSQKVAQCLSFQFCWEFLDGSSGRKSFRFWRVLIKILSSELNIFHFIVLLLGAK